MKIIVLNGSPKGDLSITMQYVHYIQKKFPQHELKIHNISQNIKKIEKNENNFHPIIEDIKSSKGVLWAFPVYKGVVPSQYMRFIELIAERNVKNIFYDKYTAALSTSARIFDHYAHNYMKAVCDDLDLRYVDFYSADYDDLRKKDERERLISFAANFFNAIENNFSTIKTCTPLRFSDFVYMPGRINKKIDQGDKKIVVLTHSGDKETNLGKMIDRFRGSFARDVEVLNLNDIDIKGGCMGCLKCWYDNVCFYNDGFLEFFSSKIIPADILLIAGDIKGRYLSYKLKEFTDRSYFIHHQPAFREKQIAEIISGPMSQVLNIMDVTQGSYEYSQANYSGAVTDECGDSAVIDAELQGIAEQLVYLAGRKYVRPLTFRGLGARKLIRDLTWSKLRAIMPDDHRHHKKEKLYDFPYKDYQSILLNLMMVPMTKIKAVRTEMTRKMAEVMIKPYQTIVKKK
ncbi:MAG: NAD(P)H-dependent oxidoreductase [Spirochaetes bacterium]|jgi:multimeric flavodoxin WrbA|nr:NAD(P)H-dependent oxidoreductase [Spirochaetota bacterium]